ncbi:AraC family transcriptional regulator [Sphingobacterium sp.]|uniref:helix-turn-helix domain-containing protein n=1 Tax=Sphingobacterium sp. TaxID=341027 RepID=UPI002896D7E7|nr:AraC family transcriptional regulator [Sphingobacterium sp.]
MRNKILTLLLLLTILTVHAQRKMEQKFFTWDNFVGGFAKEMVSAEEVSEKQEFTKAWRIYPYHQHLRMQEAARLLREVNLSVSETTYQLGLSNLSYFGRLFEDILDPNRKSGVGY